MAKLRIKLTESQIEDHTDGICIACGHEQAGVEPDAERYNCESCGEQTVFGMEQAFLLGLVDLDDGTLA